MKNLIEQAGLSDDLNNGRERLIKEILTPALNSIEALSHCGLNEDDRAYAEGCLMEAIQSKGIPSFDEMIKKKDLNIKELMKKIDSLEKKKKGKSHATN